VQVLRIEFPIMKTIWKMLRRNVIYLKWKVRSWLGSGMIWIARSGPKKVIRNQQHYITEQRKNCAKKKIEMVLFFEEKNINIMFSLHPRLDSASPSSHTDTHTHRKASCWLLNSLFHHCLRIVSQALPQYQDALPSQQWWARAIAANRKQIWHALAAITLQSRH